MAERIEPQEYIELMRENINRGNTVNVESLERRFGDQEVTLKDLEETYAQIITSLMGAYMVKDTLDNMKVEVLIDLLVNKEIIDVEERDAVLESFEEAEKIIEGE